MYIKYNDLLSNANIIYECKRYKTIQHRTYTGKLHDKNISKKTTISVKCTHDEIRLYEYDRFKCSK